MPLALRVGGFAAGFDLSRVPDAVVDYAKLCIADAIGLAFASGGSDYATRAVDAVSGLAGTGECPVVGTSLRLPPRDAALANGILIHGLDFDDTHSASVVHCSASAVPLVLAEGWRRRSSGRGVLAAYLLAVETAARVGSPAQGLFQKVGFHPTGMVGIFGAAVAAAYLAGLDAEGIAAAQGIALSMAGGSLEFLEDGAWTKRLHPGWAASSAMTAAALAGSGFVAPPLAYEGRYGLYRLYLQGNEIEAGGIFDDLGQRWETGNLMIKPYPVCHFNHACIDAMLALRAEHGLAPDDIAAVTALIHEKEHDAVCLPETAKRRPQNEYDAKFSLHYAVAAAAVRGRFTLAELEEDALSDPGILALCDRVSFGHDEESEYPRYYSGALVVETRDGRELKHRETINRGAQGRVLSAAEVRSKFDDNVARALDGTWAERLWRAVMGLDEAEDLTALDAALTEPA